VGIANGVGSSVAMPSVPLVHVIRSGVEESVHAGDVAVVDADGRVLAAAGDPERVLFARSCMKPLQAAVSLSLMSMDPPDPEAAVMCASHNAEPVHVAAVRSLLARAGVSEEALRCPSVRPWDEETAAADPDRRPINSDCSGKHAGMLAACVAHGWPLESYREPDHPVQRAVLSAVTAASGEGLVATGVDGCGVVVHAMPLRSIARIYASLGRRDGWGDLAPFADRAVGAMRAQPYLVAGRNRPDTALMEAAGDVIAKGGAEGLMCAAVLDRGIGVAVKVGDGGSRAAGPALISALEQLGVLDEGQTAALAPFATPPVLGGGRPVGEMRARFDLEGRSTG
jgi:L-asparaginase II